MRILRYSLVLLLTAVILAAGAALPSAIASLLDDATLGKVEYTDIDSIELTLAAQRAPLSIYAKLALLQVAQKIDIGFEVIENKASMTEEEVLQATDIALAPYYDAGLVEEGWEKRECRPFLYFDRNDLEKNSILWEVSLYTPHSKNAPYESLGVVIDDDTGKLLHISYYTEESVFGKEDRMIYAERFAQIYFEGAGLTEDAEYWDEHGLAEYFEPDDGESFCIRYTFGDMIYGELTFEFYVNEGGFHLYFPDSYFSS